MDNTSIFWIVASIILVLVLYYLYRKNFKLIKYPNVCFITGGVKTGKSLLTTNLAIAKYRSNYRKWWLSNKLFPKKNIEKPLFYTNVSISFGNLKKKPHKLDKNIVKITTEHLLREKRFNYNSVIYIQEASLMADNMDFANKERNVDLSLFAKLIGHETKGGYMFFDTQSILDTHYAFKRVASVYYFIQKSYDFKLFHLLYVRELINQENGVNAFNDDLDTSTRKVIVPFWYHNKYNRYEYSYLTDDLKKDNKPFARASGVVSFNPLYIERSDKRKKGASENEEKK